ncbi:MAG: hypothetical protein KDJ77_16495, partial [Rhodobiaceae bacterium]|nr:hypothetical protein [Rhodobiaceae bacterium]
MITVRRAFSGLPIVIALMAMIVVMLAQPVRAAPKILIFSAMEAPETPTDWAAVLGGVKGPEAPEKAAAIAALTAAERNPSMATAVGLLAHFETFAKNPDFRTAALGANIDVFRMADLAKYELVAETSARINDTVEGGVAAVVRVGSSGARFQAWLDWAKQNPRGPMPVDASYELSKLFKSDDDVTHWAGEHARMSNSVANELINGEAAARVFADITSEHLQQYPDEYRSLKVNLGTESVTADALTGGTEIPPTRMMVEFLSPTSAREIMANDAERTRRGWPVLIDLTTKDFLPAWILAEPEKYNGLFAAEQLHEWGIQAGFVTENPGDPLHTTVTYAQSAESGVLKPITGDDVFPSGIRDPFGWMANNYRQIFVTHKKEIEKGEVDAIAKYTLRMEDWWDKVGLRHGESLALTKDVVVPDFDVELELQPLQMAMNEIRKPSSPEARDAAITRAAATEKALFKKLVAYNEQMLIAGHRKHFNVLVQTLTDAVAADYQRNPPRPGVEQKPLTLDDIWRLAKDAGGSATRNPADPNATDTNIFHFRESLQAMANGYANLPEEAVQMLARDLAGFIETEAKRPDADPVRAEIRAAIIPTLREAVEQARSVGAELKGQAMAFEDLKAIRDSPIGEALNSELERLKQPDLDHYLLKIVRGDLTVRRLVYDPGTEGGWPALRMVEARWTPDAVAADVDRIKALAETFGWSNAGYAERLAAYFGGPRDAEGHPAPGFADRAVNLFLELGRLFEPGETVSRKVTYQTVDGETRTLTLESTKFWDSSLNIGHMLFAETIKGGEVGIKLWGIKGDVESLKGLADAMAKIISPDRNATPESRAAALASAAANALSLTSYVEMGLAKAGYSDAASALGETSVIGRFGNTFGALAQYSNDPVSREAPAAFTQAVMQDLLIWAQPQVATVLVLHSIYQAASTTYTDVYSKSALVDLFLRNGRWSFPEDGKKPVLEAVYAHGGWITDDAKGRGDQCRARLLAQGQIGKTPSFSPLGVEKLFRVPTDAEKEGIALCQGTLGEKCPMSDGSRVKPRDELMALYKSAGYASSDPLQKTTQDAVNDMLSTGIVRDVLRDIAGWADISGLGRKDLEGHGIFVPTPEDATYFVREPIRIDDNPLGIRVESDAMDTTVTAAPTWIQAQLKIGARKVYGYMVSQSWVRRQHILDCTMLDPIIAEAGRRAQEERIKTMDPTDFLDQLAVLDERVKAIDTAIWPKIAASADAYPADFPADAEKIAILRDFQRLTNDQRAALKAIDAWTKDPSSGDPPWFAIPFQLVVAPDAGPFDSPVSFPSDRPVGERLVEAGRDHLRSVLDAAIAYEEAFDAAGKTMAEVAALARSADTLDITPLHLHVLPPDSDTGTPAVPPVTTPERTPTTADFGSTIKTHKTLADLKTETAAWDKVYTEARTRAFNDMEARMAAFQQRLQPLWLEYMGRENLINNPLTAIAREQPGDLALAHPLWPRVLRLALQGARLEQAGKDGERMDEAEFAALAASITLYPVDENAPAPDLGSGDVAGRIKALKAAVDARYAEMLKLVEQMFEMSFDTDGAKWVVLGQPDVRLKTRPIAKSGLTEEMIKGWADRTVWELVPATDAMLKDVAALVSLSGETADSIPTISAVTEETQRTDRAVAAALGICSSSNRSDAFQRRFRVVETREEPVISYPLTRAGRYLMRITVLTEKGIPLAQRQAFVIVR